MRTDAADLRDGVGYIRGLAPAEQPDRDRAGTARVAERTTDEHRSGAARVFDRAGRFTQGPRLRRHEIEQRHGAPCDALLRSRQLGAEVDHGCERDCIAGTRQSAERDAWADDVRTWPAKGPGARIDPGAGEVRREQEPGREAHAPVGSLLESACAEGR